MPCLDSERSSNTFMFSFYLQILNTTAKLIQECWSQKPKARHTMLRVKKTLSKIMELTEKDKVEKCKKCNNAC